MMVTGTGHLCLRRAVALRLASVTTSTSVTSNVKYRMGSTRYLGTCGSYGPPYIYFRYNRTYRPLAVCRRRRGRQFARLAFRLKADTIMRPVTERLVV